VNKNSQCKKRKIWSKAGAWGQKRERKKEEPEPVTQTHFTNSQQKKTESKGKREPRKVAKKI